MIFDYGQLGDKFYIILKGKVGVDIPIKQNVSESEKEIRLYKFEGDKNKLINKIEECRIIQDEIFEN
jgi:hypothetical protein